jgi:hypothetical protein
MALHSSLGQKLSEEIVSDFIKVRRDVATRTLERPSAGKFVETFVQCLQHLATGTYEEKPDVDAYLSRKVENEAALDEGLRICAARVARAVYTLRNKRNIAHKNPIDPNVYDLALTHHGAAWIMSELLRLASGISMQEAGALIELVQAPVGSLIEDIDGTRLVHADTSVRGQILILLHSHYPDVVAVAKINKSLLDRSVGSINNRLSELRNEKQIFGDAKAGYRLTQAGVAAALEEISKLSTAAA